MLELRLRLQRGGQELFDRDLDNLTQVEGGATGLECTVASHDLHAGYGVSVDFPGVAGGGPLRVVDPSQVIEVRPAFRGEGRERRCPVYDW